VAPLLVVTLCAGCGKKGPPLPPLNLVPDRPAETSGRVRGDTVYLSMTIPAKNASGRGTLALDHVEIYAVTVDAGAVPPPNRDLLTTGRTIANIPVKPPVDPDAEPEEPDPDDTRPSPGDKIVFAEHLTEAETTPQVKAKPDAKPPAATAQPSSTNPAAPAATTPSVPPLTSPESVPAGGTGGGVVGIPPALPSATTIEETAAEEEETPTSTPAGSAAGAQGATTTAAATAVSAPAPTVTRVYVIRGMTKKNRPGTPSTRLVVPIVPPPPPPVGVTAEFNENSVTIAWKAPDAGSGPHPAMTYNVYPRTAAQESQKTSGVVSSAAPLNEQPLDTPSLTHAGAEPGKEQCFAVTTVEVVSTVSIESEPSAPVCVTPVDRFPPAAPTALAAVATAGAMNLIWDANHESDVSGYLVLRGEVPGGTLQPLTPEPIRETRFRDTTAQPGVRYVYAIVAVDRAGNRSAPSARVEETAR